MVDSSGLQYRLDSERLTERVARALRGSHRARFSRVAVEVHSSSVSLAGVVQSYHAKSLAYHLVRNAVPEQDVIDGIKVLGGRPVQSRLVADES